MLQQIYELTYYIRRTREQSFHPLWGGGCSVWCQKIMCRFAAWFYSLFQYYNTVRVKVRFLIFANTPCFCQCRSQNKREQQNYNNIAPFIIGAPWILISGTCSFINAPLFKLYTFLYFFLLNIDGSTITYNTNLLCVDI